VADRSEISNKNIARGRAYALERVNANRIDKQEYRKRKRVEVIKVPVQ